MATVNDQEAERLEGESRSLARAVADFRITNTADYELAGSYLTRLKAVAKSLEERRRTMTRPLDEARAAIMAFFRDPLERLSVAELGLKDSIAAYQRAQREAAERATREAELAAAKEREKLERRAARAAERGHEAKAAELASQAAVVVPPLMRPELPKLSGVASREVWKYRITDFARLPDAYKREDDKKIGGVVRALKGDTNIPGVEVWVETSIAAGTPKV